MIRIIRILCGVAFVVGLVSAIMALGYGGPIAVTFPMFLIFALAGGAGFAFSFD